MVLIEIIIIMLLVAAIIAVVVKKVSYTEKIIIREKSGNIMNL